MFSHPVAGAHESMMGSRAAVFALLVILAVSASGCKWFRRTPPPVPPPAPIPATSPQNPQVTQPTPAPEPAAAQPAPTAPTVHRPKVKPEAPQAPLQPSPPPPAFGQILTPQQQTEFRRSYQQSAQFARQTLSQISGRALTREQADTATRIRSFVSQADEAQANDPAVAAQLARRAELLARDLLNATQ
jgi:hypothetical protein